MRVAVVTPYYKEPAEILRRCHDSVLAQTHACDHLMVADGHARPEVDGWRAQHMILPQAHDDVGNTPRGLGAISALNRGYDAVAFLDADNWYAPEHVESLVATHRETGAPVVFSDRVMRLPSGQAVPPEPEELNRSHVDTSCFFITAAAASLLPIWAMMDQPLGAIGDRVMLAAVRMKQIAHAWTGKPTLYYETRYAVHFQALGLTPPEDAHALDADRIARDFSDARNTVRLGFGMGIKLGNAGP